MPSSVPGMNADQLKHLIREVPDFPKKGILFYDITTLLKDKTGFATLIDKFSEHYISQDVDLVLGMEARGFIFAPALAYRLNAGFVPVRKPGKLPAETVKYDYALEYGTDAMEMHADALTGARSVLVIDDVLATGGTAAATCRLVERAGARVAACLFLLEISTLNGRAALGRRRVESLVVY